MADVKCPMCGKPNPADAEVCEYCQARIKPLIVGNQRDSDPADWLAGLRLNSDTNPPAAEPSEPATSDSDSSDWLARIRSRHQAETPAEESTAGTEENISDWLTGLRQGTEEPGPVEDDLSRLFSEEEPSSRETGAVVPATEDALESETEPASETPSTTPGDNLNWFNTLQTEQSAASEAAATPGEDLGWLTEINTPLPSPAETRPEDDLGWLSAFQPETPTESETPVTPGEDLGWLAKSSPVEPVAEEPKAEDDLDWLNAFQPETPTESETPVTPGEDLGWLMESRPVEPTTAEPRTEDDLGWLSAFQIEPSAGSEIPLSPVAEAPQEAIEPATEPAADFDWLTGLIPTETGESAVMGPINPYEESTEIQIPAPDALPDWLVQLQSAPAQEPPFQPAQPEQPDWLRSLNGGSEVPQEPSGPFTIPVHEEPTTPVFNSSALVLPGQGIPDWLNDLPTDQTTSLPTTPAFLPDDQLTPVVPASTAALFGGQDLPDWIGQEEESVETEKTTEESPAEELEPAQLPTWLQTMRPVEAVAPTSPSNLLEDNRVEKAGPLAGLRGLVNGSETVTQYQKPPIYTVKLQVTERQRLHANLLENILNSESQASTPVREARLSPQRILRGLVTLLLLSALLTPLILNLPALIPVRNPNVLADFVSGLGEINPGDSVLLAVEYDPGLAVELEEAAGGLLEWLEQKNATITLISTSPAGPALGEALLQTTWSAETIQSNSANLGYIAGGSTALAQLASSSLQQQIGLNLLARRPFRLPVDWSIQQNFSDYKAVILLTDNVETGRAWVEQISPALGETPLLIISSAQAAPVLQAYSGAQVQSLMSGNSQTTKNSSRLAAHQIGMLVAALLILLGGVMQGILLLFKHPQKEREG